MTEPGFAIKWSGQQKNIEDASKEDFSIMCALAKQPGVTKEQAIQLFRSSPYAQIRPGSEKLDRPDYLARTYDKAEQEVRFVESRPHPGSEAGSYLTTKDLQNELALAGWSIRHNVLLQCYEVDGQSESGRDLSFDDLVTKLMDSTRGRYRGVDSESIRSRLVYIAREKQFNPVLDYLRTLAWDGQDHIQDLYNLLGTNDPLDKILIRKWLYQTIALLYNRDKQPFGAEGVLVLQGAQGACKSSLFGRLALRPEWFGDGLSLNKYDKDTYRRALCRWISELGEVESTFKRTDEGLRAFITMKEDSYRLPYGREDIKAPRRVSLCATANQKEFLVDKEGNRRWWVIHVGNNMSYESVRAFAAEQLWAQIFHDVDQMDYDAKQSCFRLTSEERDALNARNTGFEKKITAQQEV